jgi:outer membrane protein assembly factor BamB
MQTPLVYGEHLYVCRDNGVLTVFEARSGKRLSQARLGGGSSGFTASPVAADGKLYFTGETGEVHVIRAGPRAEVLAVNEMGEICMATPAISEGVLFFRTRGHVVAIGDRRRGQGPERPRGGS